MKFQRKEAILTAINFLHNPTESTRITRQFGYQKHPITGQWTGHNGIDIGGLVAGKEGDPLCAVADGKVIISKVNAGGVSSGYGYYIVIQHAGFATLYGHMQGLIVKAGQTVKAGQIIGYMGNTGTSTATHLHFGLTIGPYASTEWVDPAPYLLTEGDEEEMDKATFKKFADEYHNDRAAETMKSPDNDWSKEARTWAETKGIISGNQYGYKQYKSMCTREMIVVILYKFYKLLKGGKL